MGRKPTKHLNLPKGMRLRKRGKLTYYTFDLGGKPRREEMLGQDYALALKKYAELKINTRIRPDLVTFKYAVDRYRRDVLFTKAEKTRKDNEKQFKWLLQYFKDAPLEDVEPVHVRQYLDWRKSSPVAANREKALFSHVWNKCLEWGYTARPNPCQGIKGFRESGRDIYVEDAAFNAVWRVATPPLRDAMDLAYLIGQRPADVLQAKETDIRDGHLHLRQGKTGKKQRFIIQGRLEALINRIRARKASYAVHSTFLVINESGQPLGMLKLKKLFLAAREAAGQDFQFRDIRAKALTDRDAKAGSREAQKLGGHASVTMTEGYIRNRKGDAVEPTE